MSERGALVGSEKGSTVQFGVKEGSSLKGKRNVVGSERNIVGSER